MTPDKTVFEVNQTNMNYWKEIYRNDYDPEYVRLDFHRQKSANEQPEKEELDFGEKAPESLFAITKGDPFLVYCVLSAALRLCLHKYSRKEEIALGSPPLVAEGASPDIDFPLLIPTGVRPSLSFKQLLVQVKNVLAESYRKQNFSFPAVMEELGMDSGKDPVSFFSILFSMEDIHLSLPASLGDIHISCSLRSGVLKGTVYYNPVIFRQETIKLFGKYFNRVLRQALENIDILCGDVSLLDGDEKEEMLRAWADTPFPEDKCIFQLFEEQAERNPGAPAVIQGERRLSYGQLNSVSNQLAHYLKRKKVRPDMMIGLFCDRSPEMIIGLLGILKAGCAYVPVDPAYPKDRIETMLKAAELEIIITKETLKERLPATEADLVCLDAENEAIACQDTTNITGQAGPNNICYVIFTSGSTGVPKGAAVYHKGWTNLLHWFSTEFGINAGDRNLIMSSFSFDITQRAIAMSLINGNELHLLNSNHYDPDLVLETIKENRITVVNCSPSTFYPLIEGDPAEKYPALSSLRCLFLGGEVISPSRLKHWALSGQCHAQLANVYGVAECADVSSFHILRDYDRYIRSSVPAGIPIFNSQLYVVHESDSGELSLVPEGIVGELCIAGCGVGKGYINDPVLSAGKYIPNPFRREGHRDEVLYRTGDLARFLPEGNIELIGRADYQIKVRGYRIDLQDIEASLRLSEKVREAVVVDRKFSENDHRLIAYVVPEAACPEGEQESFSRGVREFASFKLPDYMVPNIIVVLNALPLNPNGKVDRKALPQVDIESAGNSGGGAENEVQDGSGTLEDALGKIFANALKVDDVGPEDNFFEMGGHSLLATQVISSANEILGVKLNQADLLTSPTVNMLSRRIRTKYGYEG